MFRQALLKPTIDAVDIRLAEGFRSPFWKDELPPDHDPLIAQAVDLFARIRTELAGIKTQAAIYGITVYVIFLAVTIVVDLTTESTPGWFGTVHIVMLVWLVASLLQGWHLFWLVAQKDRAIDEVARDSVARYESWLERLKTSDPEEYIRITTWETDESPLRARMKLNEYF
jgi:hypothetical protein